MRTLLLVALSGLSTNAWILAQSIDLFEIKVYQPETLPQGKWELETHLNYIARGTKQAEGREAPTDNQLHLSLEFTRGLAENFQMAGFLLVAERPGGGFEYAGARLFPLMKAPERWNLPVDLGLAFELGFPRPQYEASSVTFGVRPLVGKRFSTWQVLANLGLERAWRGPETEEGFEFKPSVKLSYFLKKERIHAGVEYYASTGPLTHFEVVEKQVHVIFPALDVFFHEKWEANLGAGLGMTEAGERLILKLRFGYRF